MDDREYLKQLRRREKELLARIDKMRKTMDETVELGTLGFMSELLEQAKKELTRIQEKLRSSGSHED
jgi:hypothetical protein